jgi:hypothetical protein
MFSSLVLKMDFNLEIHTNNTAKDDSIDYIQLQKLKFIYSALENGWAIKKQKDAFIFSKKHEGKKEIFLETYLRKFIEENMKNNV